MADKVFTVAEKAAIRASFDPRLRFNVDEAAVFLACSRAHVYRLIREGDLPVHKEGRRTFVMGSDVARLCALAGSRVSA